MGAEESWRKKKTIICVKKMFWDSVRQFKGLRKGSHMIKFVF